MILVTVSDQKHLHGQVIQTIFEHLTVRVRPKVDFQLAVDHGAAASANFFPAVFPGITALLTLAEKGRNAFRRRSSHKQNFHCVNSPSDW